MPGILRRSARAIVLALPPGLAAAMLYVQHDLPGVRMFAIIAGAYAALATLAFVLAWRSPSEVAAMAEAVAGLEHDVWKQRLELQTQIDILTAEREIGLILREDTDFRAVLERTLAVLARLLGSDCAIEIHVGAALKAVWSEGRAWFDRGLTKRARQAEAGAWDVERPLAYDGEEIGRLRMRGDFTGPEERVERGRQLEARAEEIAGFVALALKTPDLYARATRDALTGLGTKRHMIETLETLAEAARRERTPLSLVMVDIDHFKRINDTHGHPVGDRVLAGVAEAVRRSVRGRSGECGFRYGGEELAVLLPRVPLARAIEVAERVRAAIEEKEIAGVRVTASLGVAQYAGARADAVIECADAALYRAKRAGRNRVECDGARRDVEMKSA